MRNISDIPSTWRRVARAPLLYYSLDILRANGELATSQVSVFLPWHDGLNIEDIRAWIIENVDKRLGRVKLHIRILWQDGVFETDVQFSGLVFSFDKESDAVLFKLRWYESV